MNCASGGGRGEVCVCVCGLGLERRGGARGGRKSKSGKSEVVGGDRGLKNQKPSI